MRNGIASQSRKPTHRIMPRFMPVTMESNMATTAERRAAVSAVEPGARAPCWRRQFKHPTGRRPDVRGAVQAQKGGIFRVSKRIRRRTGKDGAIGEHEDRDHALQALDAHQRVRHPLLGIVQHRKQHRGAQHHLDAQNVELDGVVHREEWRDRKASLLEPAAPNVAQGCACRVPGCMHSPRAERDSR